MVQYVGERMTVSSNNFYQRNGLFLMVRGNEEKMVQRRRWTGHMYKQLRKRLDNRTMTTSRSAFFVPQLLKLKMKTMSSPEVGVNLSFPVLFESPHYPSLYHLLYE